MTTIPKSERDELRALINGEFSGGVDAIAVALQCGRLLDALDAAEADSAELRDTLRRHGFQPCDITACNCNGWHQTGGFYARFNEIDEAVGEHDGERADALAQRDRAEAELDAERKMRVAAEEHTAMEMADLADVERMAWEALGKPDGTHETSNVQRLCEAFAAMQSAIAHAAARFDVSDEKRAEDAPISAEVHFREAVRTIARTLPSSTRAVDRGAIWGELREMDRLHADNANLSADLAETKAKLAALTGVVLRMRNDMGPIVFGEDIDTVEDAIAAARGGAS